MYCGTFSYIHPVFMSGRDPDPAREAVNQMHRALLPGAGAEDGGLGQQTAPPARTGDAFSGTTCFLFLCFLFFHSCSVFKQRLDPRVIYQYWRSRGDSSHYTSSLSVAHILKNAKTHTLTHNARCILMRLRDHRRAVLIFITTQWRCDALHTQWQIGV